MITLFLNYLDVLHLLNILYSFFKIVIFLKYKRYDIVKTHIRMLIRHNDIR